jgi:hypothetical protein
MPESALASAAQSAGEELARRLRIPCDIVDVHRFNDSRKKIFARRARRVQEGGLRAAATARSVELVERAIQGETFAPKL